MNLIDQTKLDNLVAAIDRYSTESAHRQRHMKGRWNTLVRDYCQITGMKRDEADKHLQQIIF